MVLSVGHDCSRSSWMLITSLERITLRVKLGLFFFSVRFVLMEFHLWFYRPFFSPIRFSAALQPALISAVGIADILSRLWFFPYPLFQASWECSVQHSTAKGSWLSSSHVEIDHLSLPCRLLFSLLLALEKAFPFILWLHSYLDVILCCGFITARSRRLSSRPCLLPPAAAWGIGPASRPGCKWTQQIGI